jgi:hypothetical protein
MPELLVQIPERSLLVQQGDDDAQVDVVVLLLGLAPLLVLPLLVLLLLALLLPALLAALVLLFLGRGRSGRLLLRRRLLVGGLVCHERANGECYYRVTNLS